MALPRPSSIVDLVATRERVWVKPDDPVWKVRRVMIEKGLDGLLVMDGDKVVGIVTTNDIVFRLALEAPLQLDGPVSDIMTKDVHSLEVTHLATPAECAAVMHRLGVRHLPLYVNRGSKKELVGLATVLDALLAKTEAEDLHERERTGALQSRT